MAEFPKYYKVNVVSKNSENVSVDFEPIYEDLEPVVRCKDCKWCEKHIERVYKEPWYTCSNEEVISMIYDDFVYVDNLNHFYSYGERKDGVQDGAD